MRAFLAYAGTQGAATGDLLARSALTQALLEDPDSRLPLAAYKALIDAAVAATGDAAIAARFSVSTRIESISIVGLIVHSSRSMADAMAQLNRYSRLVVELDVMTQTERFPVQGHDGQVWIVDQRPEPDAFPALTESAFGRFIGEFRTHRPDMKFALEIQMTHATPAHAQALLAILQVPLAFGCKRNAMRIAPEVMQMQFEASNGYAFGLFAERADALLARLEENKSIRARVEAWLVVHLHRGEITMESVAREMGMSRQTLFRRLRDEGVSFAQIHDDLRHRMALDYLRARKASVNETAYLVGFSEASAFVRAFRRWTGSTPIAFRKQAMSDE